MASCEQFLPSSTRPAVDAPASSGLCGALCVVASITNLRQIERAYGEQLALAVRHVVLERARQFCRLRRGIAALSGDQLLFVFDAPVDGVPAADPDSAAVGLLLDRLLAELGEQPVDVASDVVFVALAAAAVESADGAFDLEAVAADAACAGHDEHRWRERFLADMKDAERLFCAMQTGRLVFDLEPVCDLRDPDVIRYYEVVPFWTSHGVRRQVADMVAPLRRLGLVGRLDRWSVEAVVGALRRNPGIALACNVTSASALPDAGWAVIFAALAAQPELARRLVVELSEVGPGIDFAGVGRFARKLQSLGCRVALDHVGGGNSSIEALTSLGADIVKVDAICLHRTRTGERAVEALHNLVRLARGSGADVVLTGVEDGVDATTAELAGATHVQGSRYQTGIFLDVNIGIANQ